MVNWKTSESTDRLVAALIAAHPTLKLEYQAIAVMFDQGATYDAIEGRFRRYRKMAEELKAEAVDRGVTELPRGRNGGGGGSSVTTPRTPRGPRGGITKVSSSSGKGKKGEINRALTSPTKKKNNSGMTIMDAIFLDDSFPEENSTVKNEAAEILSGLDAGIGVFHDPQIPSASTTASSTASTTLEESSEESMDGFLSSFGGTVKQESRGNAFVNGRGVSEATAIHGVGVQHDDFDMTGLYFGHGNGGYMDDIYGGAA